MTSSDVWGEQTAARYDADSADRFAPAVLGPTVDFLARLAGPGAALAGPPSVTSWPSWPGWNWSSGWPAGTAARSRPKAIAGG